MTSATPSCNSFYPNAKRLISVSAGPEDIPHDCLKLRTPRSHLMHATLHDRLLNNISLELTPKVILSNIEPEWYLSFRKCRGVFLSACCDQDELITNYGCP